MDTNLLPQRKGHQGLKDSRSGWESRLEPTDTEEVTDG